MRSAAAEKRTVALEESEESYLKVSYVALDEEIMSTMAAQLAPRRNGSRLRGRR